MRYTTERICGACGKRFGSKRGRWVHFGRKHNSEFPWLFDTDLFQDIPTCPILGCYYSTDSGHGMAEHCSMVHGIELSEEYPEFDTSRTKEEIENIKRGQPDNFAEIQRERMTGRKHSEETKRKLRKDRIGESNPMYGRELSEEEKEEISKRMSGENHPLYGTDNPEQSRRMKENNPMDDENVVKKMLKTKAQNRKKYVEELGYSVDSGWEEEIGFLLEGCGIKYERAPEFEMENWEVYCPDFLTGRFAIEVKGYYKTPEKAKEFMELYTEYFYVVIGEYQPCHIFIEWENRDKLKDLVEYR